MHGTDEPAETQTVETPAWAQRLAARRQKTYETEDTSDADVERWITNAVEILWKMFDQAVDQATSALERSGSPDRIAIQRTQCDYRLTMPGPDEQEREISVFASLRAANGQPSGGCNITTSQTRATIHLTPSTTHGRLHWIVPVTGADFTPRVVADLFLSVFSDDPSATKRLSPLFTAGP